jgi:hypothetical protein
VEQCKKMGLKLNYIQQIVVGAGDNILFGGNINVVNKKTAVLLRTSKEAEL